MRTDAALVEQAPFFSLSRHRQRKVIESNTCCELTASRKGRLVFFVGDAPENSFMVIAALPWSEEPPWLTMSRVERGDMAGVLTGHDPPLPHSPHQVQEGKKEHTIRETGELGLEESIQQGAEAEACG